MIIVEGFDNSGKSTLVKKLSKDLKLLVMNNQRLPKSAVDVQDYLSLCGSINHRYPLILDRLSVISEPIYGPICRDQSILTPLILAHMRAQLLELNPAIVYCRPPTPAILNFEEEQMEGVVDKAMTLIAAYDFHMSQLDELGFNVVVYDWQSTGYEDFRDFVKQGI